MQFNIEKSEMMELLNTAGYAMSNTPQLPILLAVKLVARDGKLTVISNSVEIAIKCSAEADIAEEGEICVEFKMFKDIISKTSLGSILFESDTKKICIKNGKSKFEISSIDSKDFPDIQETEDKYRFTVISNEFKDALKKCIPFASIGGCKKPVLEGVLLNINKSNIDVVASDGLRVAEVKINCTSDTEQPFIIPAIIAKKITGIVKNDDTELKVISDGRSVVFEYGDCSIYVRMIDGVYLNYKPIFDLKYKTTVNMDRYSAIESIERTNLLTNTVPGNKIPAVMDIEKDKILLSCTTAKGTNKETLTAKIEGDGLRIGFNCKFLLDALNACEDEEIKMQFKDAVSGCQISCNERSRYLVLPVRLYN